MTPPSTPAESCLDGTPSALADCSILFTCAGRRVELMQSFRHAMKLLNLRGKLCVAEASRQTATSQIADEAFVVPRAQDEAYLPALLEIVKTHRIGLIVPLTDLDLTLLAREQAQFRALGCEVAIGNLDSVSICRDKLLFASELHAKGILTIPTQTIDAFTAEPVFPCFAKPLSGSGSIGARKLNSAKELAAHSANHDDLILQPVVDGQEFTIDIYKSRSGEVKSIVPRQRLRVRAGEIEQGITVDDPALIQAARDLAEALDGLWGVFCAQCRRTPEGEILFYEVNPRFGGGAPLSIAAGANLPLYLIQDVLGLDITTDGSFQPNLMMMRYPAAVFETIDQPSELDGYTTPISR